MFRNSKPRRTRRFDLIWARYLKLFTKLGWSTLALGTLATAGNAQNGYQGKFTLAVETHWRVSPCRPAITLSLTHPTALLTDYTSGDRELVPSSRRLQPIREWFLNAHSLTWWTPRWGTPSRHSRSRS